MGSGQGESNLDEFSFLDVVPDQLVLQLLRKVVRAQSFLGVGVARELCVLNVIMSTMAMSGYQSASVAMRSISSSKLCAHTSRMGEWEGALRVRSRSSSSQSSVSALLAVCALFRISLYSFMIIKTAGHFLPSYYQLMLKFNPQHQLTLAPTPDNRLAATLLISNPTIRAAPFKVKSTRPSLFTIQPPTGILLPHQSMRVLISTRSSQTPQLAHEISYHNKFLIEFALVESVPQSVSDGLRMINEDNRQQHRLFLGSIGKTSNDNDARSGISNQYSYRTVEGDQERPLGNASIEPYEGLNTDQKFEYLTREIDRLEKEKSQLIMTSSPKKGTNLVKIVLVLIVGLVVGNLLGRAVGLGRKTVQKKEGWMQKGVAKISKMWSQKQESRQWYEIWK